MEVFEPSFPVLKKQYPCSECGKNFNRNSHLARHRRLHTGEKPYKCPECGKDFRQSTDVTTHRRIHTGETPYHCNECGKSFRYRTGLVKHLRCHEIPQSSQGCETASGNSASKARHVVEEPYICTDCGKRVEGTNIHVHTTMEEPYECPDCGKSFRCSFQLIRHRRLQTRFHIPNPNVLCSLNPGGELLGSDHHGSEETPCSGSICEDDEEEENLGPARPCQTLSKRLSGLVSQRPCCKKKRAAGAEGVMPPFSYTQRRHVCFICGMGFKYEPSLITHELGHMQEKPFKCGTCQKSFRDETDLQNHQKVHSEDKCFNCLDCGRSFRKQVSFIKHLRLHPCEKPSKPSRVYFAVLPQLQLGAEGSIGDRTEPPETLGCGLTQTVSNLGFSAE